MPFCLAGPWQRTQEDARIGWTSRTKSGASARARPRSAASARGPPRPRERRRSSRTTARAADGSSCHPRSFRDEWSASKLLELCCGCPRAVNRARPAGGDTAFGHRGRRPRWPFAPAAFGRYCGLHPRGGLRWPRPTRARARRPSRCHPTSSAGPATASWTRSRGSSSRCRRARSRATRHRPRCARSCRRPCPSAGRRPRASSKPPRRSSSSTRSSTATRASSATSPPRRRRSAPSPTSSPPP